MTESEQRFPPQDAWDIAAYPVDDVVDGYRSHSIDDHPPGDNRSPGYRWGWTNARKDVSRVDDGFESVRSDYIRLTKHVN
jgi:hypothetical protein